MASKQSEAVAQMYRSWTFARLHPETTVQEPRETNDRWGDASKASPCRLR
jgi:hypothetical protein